MSLRRSDLLSLAGLRQDGRQSHELRRFRVEFVDRQSVLVQQGLTTAMASVVPNPQFQVTVQYAPSAERRNQSSRKLLELSRWIQSTLIAVLLESDVHIRLVILQDDGGTAIAACHAAYMACANAGVPSKGLLCCCSVGRLRNHILVDLNRREEMDATPTVVIGMLEDEVVLFQSATSTTLEEMDEIIDAAKSACEAVYQVLQASLRMQVTTDLSAQQGKAFVQVALG